MRTLHWPGIEITKRRNEPDYEWAYMKAHLDVASDSEVYRVYDEMFGKPAEATPAYLVQLAIQYGALNIGHARTSKKQPSIEREVFACLDQLDETAFKNNKNVYRYCQRHDTELVEFKRGVVLTEG